MVAGVNPDFRGATDRIGRLFKDSNHVGIGRGQESHLRKKAVLPVRNRRRRMAR